MKAVRFSSGEARPDVFGLSSGAVHLSACRSHVQRRSEIVKEMVRPFGSRSNCVNGRLNAEYVVPDAIDRATASLAWSNAGWRVPRTASNITNSVPFSVTTRYQKRSSGSHVGRTPECNTSGFALYPRNFSALA